mgnify:CR=1 FL=1
MLLPRTFVTLSLVAGLATTPTVVQVSRYEDLASLPFKNGYPSKEGITALKDELIFQRAVQSYLWALPVLNMYGMKEGSEKVFGKGYNMLPIWKQRLNAKTLITTPNSDVIYALGYLDLKEDGPMVIEVPPGLQGILDDFFQRPICSEGTNRRRRSGAATSVCPAPTRARAADISCCRQTSRAKRPRDISRSGRARMEYSCSGAVSSRTRSNSTRRSR